MKRTENSETQSFGMSNEMAIWEPALTLKERLWNDYGPIMDNRAICKVLHYRPSSFKAACTRGLVHLPLFTLPGRRGVFVFTDAVADMLEASAARGVNSSDLCDERDKNGSLPPAVAPNSP